MSGPDRVIVLSDVHLTAEGPLASFREEAALAAFLRRQLEGPPTELVLAGDVFDFLTTPGYAGLDPSESPGRLAAILDSPRVAPVVDALTTFVRHPGNRLTVLAGNHDPELLLPDVRSHLEGRLGAAEPVRWADDEPLVAARDGHRPMWGRRLAAGPDVAWVVHGDRWDPHNLVDRDRLRSQVDAGRPVALPVGSHLVFRVLSHLAASRPWVYELKPELPAVLLLLLYLDPRPTLQFLSQHLKIGAALLKGYLQGALRDGPAFGESDAAASVEATTTDDPEVLARWIVAAAAPDVRRAAATPDRALAAWAAWCEDGPPAPGTLAAHGGVGRALARAWLRAARAADRPPQLDQDDEVVGRFDPTQAPDVTLLVAGHTHGPRARSRAPLRYLNTGTWLPIARLPDGDVEPWIDDVDAGRWPATSPRTAVELRLTPTGIDGSLLQCDDDGRAEAIGHA